ncbi:serine endopeptidase [Thozetella sp. PMI_491]|nr:serine endopeptidase [Thozetella sp. PMI_491]
MVKMQLSSLLLGLCLAGGSAAVDRRVLRRDDGLTAPVGAPAPKRFIVEFAEGVDPTVALESLTSASGAKVVKVFNSDVFQGAALESDEDNVDSLQALTHVAQAWTSRRIPLAPVDPAQVFSADATANATSSRDIHFMTGVDKLHAAGILGKGVNVGVVDTGVAYRHPALGGGFGPGFKVAGGYDLVGNEYWPNEGQKTPDSDPDDQQGHGTHVSGIIAGNGENFVGVAPEANIYMYKVFTHIDNTDEDTLIEAFLRAYDDGVDIISSSIGGASGFVNGAWALVASRLVEQGVVVTISAGNSGADGPFVASSGSSGANVLAIASVNGATIFAPTFDLSIDGAISKLAYLTSDDWTVASGLPIVPLTLDTTVAADACTALPSTTPDFTGKVVLVRRGSCTFATKQANLAPFNAKYILFYSTPTASLTAPGTDDHSSIVAMITPADGATIVNAYKAGSNLSATFFNIDSGEVKGINNTLGGLASTFTSIGPTNELFIKPDVAAPGGSIFSTYLDGGWAVLSGTSMACPYVAGVAALYIGQYGGRKTNGVGFAKALAARIMTSGEIIPWDPTAQTGGIDNAISSVAQVGTGLINATKVLSFETQLSYDKFALNDTHHFSRYHSVDVTNTGKSSITYSFELEAAGGFYAAIVDPEDSSAPRMAIFGEALAEPAGWVPEVSLPSSFTLAPGQTKTAKVSFNYPTGLDGTRVPVYSGNILVKGSNAETLRVPYLGVASDLHKDIGQVFEYPWGAPLITSTRENIPIANKANFTFDLSVDKQDFPNLWSILKYATTELRWDIFESTWKERDWVYPPVVGKAGYVGSATAWAGDSSEGKIFNPATNSSTNLLSFPQINVPRDYSSGNGTHFWWLGQLANGTTIAPGTYQFRIAALVPFGTPGSSNNWDVFQTPPFTVL